MMHFVAHSVAARRHPKGYLQWIPPRESVPRDPLRRPTSRDPPKGSPKGPSSPAENHPDAILADARSGRKWTTAGVGQVRGKRHVGDWIGGGGAKDTEMKPKDIIE